jgi:hypothetical protein
VICGTWPENPAFPWKLDHVTPSDIGDVCTEYMYIQLCSVGPSVQTTNLGLNYAMSGSHFACRLLVQASQLSLDQVLWGTYRT